MAKYMISYDLHAPTNNRTAVQEAIESIGAWRKHVSTTYLVKTSLPIKEVQSICTKPLDENDRMIIVEITGYVHGYLTDAEWQSLQQDI